MTFRTDGLLGKATLILQVKSDMLELLIKAKLDVTPVREGVR